MLFFTATRLHLLIKQVQLPTQHIRTSRTPPPKIVLKTIYATEHKKASDQRTYMRNVRLSKLNANALQSKSD